jgi:hypothetical protein
MKSGLAMQMFKGRFPCAAAFGGTEETEGWASGVLQAVAVMGILDFVF